MSGIVITVQGRHTVTRPAEVGTLTLAIESEGETARPVLNEASGAAASVRALLTEAGESVRSWTADEVRTWSERPWAGDGRRSDPVLHARADVIAEFVDIDGLSRVVGAASEIDGVTIQGIRWALTDEAHAHALNDARWGAVADATTTATTYAAALGFDSPSPTAIADAGMLDGSVSPAAPITLAATRAFTETGGVELRPQPIVVEAAVDIRFAAG